MKQTFSIRDTFKQAAQVMKPMQWKLIQQYALISFVFSLALYFLFGSEALIAMFITMFILSDWVLGYTSRQSFTFAELFERYTFKDFVYFVCAMVLVTVSVVGGMLLLIVPGIVFAVRLYFVRYIALEQKLSPMASLKESKRITKGYRWKLFLFMIVSMLINIVGLFCLIVGVFYTAPLTQLARGILYKNLSQKAV